MASKSSNDTPEDIQRCLSCKRVSCNNCLAFEISTVRKSKQKVQDIDLKVAELSKTGMNATEIAKQLGVAICTVTRYRKALGFATQRGHSIIDDHLDVFWEMYNKGCMDREIAEVIGCSSGAVCDYRKKYDLPCNGRGMKVVKKNVRFVSA